MGKFIDMTGWIMKEHGVPNSRLTVIKRITEKASYSKPILWLCVCECGTETIVRGSALREGLILSCGCYQKNMPRKHPPQKKTTTSYLKELRQKNIEVIPLEDYIDTDTKIKHKFLKCNHIAMVAPKYILQGKGCGVCKGKQIQPEINSLALHRPDLAIEWSPKNTIEPTQVTSKSTLKVWWICSKCQHEWEASIQNRNRGTGCPKCKRYFHTSFAEQAFYYYLQQHFTVINQYKDMGKEIDIYIPSLKLGIEYNGSYWHKNKQKQDEEKINFFKSKGINIIVVQDGSNNKIQDNKIIHKEFDLEYAINALFNILHIKTDINIKRDSINIQQQYMLLQQTQSFLTCFPKKAKEWDYDKNGNITPDKIKPYSNRKFWRICPMCKQSYLISISSWTRHKQCLRCAGGSKKVIQLTQDNNIIKVHDSLSQASKLMNYKSCHSILSCCKGKRELVKGYRWEYLTPETAEKYRISIDKYIN